MNSKDRDRKQIEAGVGGLILGQDGKILLVRSERFNNKWVVPGGHIEFGEPIITALKREIFEETGLEVEVQELLMVKDLINHEHFRDRHILLHNYLCTTSQKEVRLNHEAQEYRWVTITQALGMNLGENTRELIHKYMEYLEKMERKKGQETKK